MFYQKLKIKHYLKIGLALFMAYLTVSYASPKVFIANSPQVSPSFIASIINAPTYVANLPSTIWKNISGNGAKNIAKKDSTKQIISKKTGIDIAKIKEKSTTKEEAQQALAKLKKVTPPPNIAFKELSTGVRASEPQANGQVIIQMDKGAKYCYKEFEITMKNPQGVDEKRTVKILDVTCSNQ